MEPVYLGTTVAQYLAWFVTGGDRAGRLHVSLAGIAAALLGLALAGSLWAVACAVVALTAGAFAFEARSAGARTAALAASYTLVFTAYFGISPRNPAWCLGAVLGGGAVALLVPFVLWPDDRAPRRADLVRAHLDAAAALPAWAARKGAVQALRRLRAQVTPIEAALAAHDETSRRMARRLVELRVLISHAATSLDAAHLARRLARFPTQGGAPDPAGRALAALATLDVGRDRARVPPAPQRETGSWRDRLPSALKRAAQVGTAMAAALPAGIWLSPERWAWSFLAAMLVFYGTSTAEDVLAKGWHRARGTLIGGVAGLVLAEALRGDRTVEIVSIVALQFVAVAVRPAGYAWTIAASTALLALFLGVGGSAVPSVLELRMGETLAGAVAGLLTARLVFSSHAARRSGEALADLLDELASFLGGGGAHPAERKLSPQLDRLRQVGAPVCRLRIPGLAREGSALERRLSAAERIVLLAELAGLDRIQGSAPCTRAAQLLGSARDALRGDAAPSAAPAGAGTDGVVDRALNAAERALEHAVHEPARP